MMIVHSYPLAVVLCVLTMICWGSHANTLKMEPKSYGFALYCWDWIIGYLLMSIALGLTFGSFGSTGRGLIHDLLQANASSFAWALAAGVVYQFGNITFFCAIDIAGMAVAFPIGIGLALVQGVLINYFADPKGSAALIFTGVALITVAIILDAFAYRSHGAKSEPGEQKKGVILALLGGFTMGLFYLLLQRSLSPDYTNLAPGKFGPYAAALIFSLGAFLSNGIFNSYLMARPFKGATVNYSDYFAKGRFNLHLIGALGGLINLTGLTSNIVASKAVSPAIAYGLGQGATMVAAIWGIFFWKEFKGASKKTIALLTSMMICFFVGLSLLVIAMA